MNCFIGMSNQDVESFLSHMILLEVVSYKEEITFVRAIIFV